MDSNAQAGSFWVRLAAVLTGAAGTFSLFAASFVIPPLGFFSGIIAPFPVMYFRLRYGRAMAAIIFLAAVSALAVLFGVNAAVVYLLQCGVMALVLPELLLRGCGAARTIAWTTGVNVALLAVAAVIFTLVGGQDLQRSLSGEISSSIAHALALYEQGGVKGDELSMVKQSMDMAAAVLLKIYPSLATILLGIMAGCNLALLRRPALLMGYQLQLGAFRELRLPEPLVWILIVAGFALLVPNPIVTTPALNVLAVTTTLYFLQGLAVVLTIAARHPFGGIMRVFLWVMLLVQPYLAAIIAAIGIFDIWGDFRTPNIKKNL